MATIAGVLILAVILIACIFMLTYAAHDKVEGEDCEQEQCDGDCFHCGKKIG
jgi:hypothetical protein